MQRGPSIPWSLAELIYVGYAAQFGRQQSLERLAERNGFSWREVEVIYGDPIGRRAIDAALSAAPPLPVAQGVPERQELERLRKLINTPEIHDFAKGVVLEAAHQREKWGATDDAGKTNEDWRNLLGYLSQKVLDNLATGNLEKAVHHTITTAAACANWHAALTDRDTSMRPGFVDPNATLPNHFAATTPPAAPKEPT